MNALDTPVKAQVHGKYFTFTPNEIKMFHNEKVAEFLAQYRGEDGLVQISDETMELDKKSEEYKKAILDKRTEGIKKFVQKQNWIIRNLEMSLRRDYETSGQKGNYQFEASSGELAAYKNIKKYREFEQDQKLNIADEISKLREEIYGEGSDKVSVLTSESDKK
jgi:hypothetical protein